MNGPIHRICLYYSILFLLYFIIIRDAWIAFFLPDFLSLSVSLASYFSLLTCERESLCSRTVVNGRSVDGGREERATETPPQERGNCWPGSHLNSCFGQLGQGHGNNHRLELAHRKSGRVEERSSDSQQLWHSVNALETLTSIGGGRKKNPQTNKTLCVWETTDDAFRCLVKGCV